MNDSDILDLIRQHRGVVAYFSTPSCRVCTILRPKVMELTAVRHKLRFVYVDTAEHPAIAGQHLVFAAPTIILFSQGREVTRFSRNVSLPALERYLDVLAAEASGSLSNDMSSQETL